MNTPARKCVIGLLLFTVYLVGCRLFAPPEWRPGSARAPVEFVGGPRMDHAAHVERGLACADCHAPDPRTGEPGSPSRDDCAQCHDEIDEAWPAQKRVATAFFRPDGTPRWRRAVADYDPEVIFDHRGHGAMSCLSCHGAVTRQSRRVAGELHTMDQCMHCHERQTAANECATCHRVLRDDKAPANHRYLWKERHGQIVRNHGSMEAGRCDICHRDASYCDDCHQDEPPRDHTALFRIRTHGVHAAMDRQKCATCHMTDFCQRCHENTPPRSHRGVFATGRNTHCVQCHFPVTQTRSCRVCHFENPTHDTAPDQPPSHFPGMSCRNCHNAIGQGGARPLRHLDNGQVCESCHR